MEIQSSIRILSLRRLKITNHSLKKRFSCILVEVQAQGFKEYSLQLALDWEVEWEITHQTSPQFQLGRLDLEEDLESINSRVTGNNLPLAWALLHHMEAQLSHLLVAEAT
jgi:hypothetical protein